MVAPATRSQLNRWHLVGQGLDFYLDVPTPPRWQRPENARLLVDPYDDSVQVTIRGDGTLPKRRGQLEMVAYQGPDRNALMDLILEAWRRKGPYTLTQPGGQSWPMVFDPSGGQMEEAWDMNGGRHYLAAIRET